jgi:hypothetical protein
MGALKLTITETVLVFVGIPAAIIAIIYGLVYAGTASSSKRYRPGRPFNQATVWFVANKPHAAEVTPAAARQIGRGSAAHEISGGTGDHSASTHDDAAHDTGEGLATVGYGETGGASDSW